MRGALIRLIALTAAAAMPFHARAIPATQPELHVLDVWQTEQGLPQNHVTAITQTRDGYLWLGTYEGLGRFDGVRFITINAAREPGLASSRITSLFEDAAGTLWIGHEHGQLSRLVRGRFDSVLTNPVSPQGSILGMASDGEDHLWLLRRSGTAERLHDHRVTNSIEGLTMPVLCRESNGPLWRIHAGRMTPLTDESSRSTPGKSLPTKRTLPLPRTDEFIVNACPARDGGVWVLSGTRLRRWNRDGSELDAGPPPWGDRAAPRMLEARSGELWIGTQELGLFVRQLDGHYLHYGLTNGLRGDWVRGMTEDREGTVWVGTGGGGLCAIRPRRVQMIQAPDGWQGRGLLSVSPQRDGSIWIGTEGAGLYHVTRSGFRRFGLEDGLANTYVWAVLDDGISPPWVGTWGRGLFHRDQDTGRWLGVPGLNDNGLVVTALCPGRSNALWVGTQNGLARRTSEGLEWIGRELISPEVRCIAETSNGTVWFGMAGGGLGRWQNGKTQQFRKPEGLPSNDVWSLLSVGDDTLWIGTVGGGLCRWRDGQIRIIGERQGLPSDVVCQIIDDGQGNYWLGTRGGIARAARVDLERCAEGQIASVKFFTFDKSDGLATLECSGGSQPSHGRMPDGSLLFPTTRGLAVIHPARLTTNEIAPPVLIESLAVGGHEQPLPWPRTRRIEIPPGGQRIDLRFTALTYIAPERVRFRYRLEGMEESGAELTSQRSVSYNFLPPGRYTFHVTACNADGIWNPTEATLSFAVLPRLWQTWWFQVSGGIAFALVVGGMARVITRRRYRQKLDRIERQRAVERERSRIARDIHDDIGASLTRITLLSQSAVEDLNDPEIVGAHLQRIDATARELTKALEEIVWAVNPRHDTLDSLVTYLGRFAQDLTSAAGVRCRIEIPTELPACPLTAEIRHNLFLALKEALHNAIRHAQATQITVGLALTDQGFVLRVEDDGVGFHPARLATAPVAAATGHGNGLQNMRRRLEEIGGHCEVASQPGAGTIVRLVIKTDDKASFNRPSTLSP